MKSRLFYLLLSALFLLPFIGFSKGVSPALVRQAARNITPLLTTKWNQGCFYNSACPNDTAAKTTCLHAVTGSGATAMAQIMKFYQYPVHGNGEHGYTSTKYGIQYANFGATTYNWSAMPDSLTTLDNEVATLLYHCGVAQNTDFGTTFSGSDSSRIDTGFIKYFGYSATAVWKWKKNFTDTDWLNLLKTQLDASHPLLYYGNNNGADGGFFVCDGYQGSDLFHFNWGWGGAYDGYYNLNSLTPGTGNFTSAQGAIFDLVPLGSVPSVYTMDFEDVPDFSLTFNGWTVKDVDMHSTYGITGYSFPHQNEPMAFLSFNPAQVSPSMASDQAIQPHGGQRFGACFSSNPPSNDDWFISPKIQLGTNGSFSFWVKSYNDTYGLDKYIVAVSVTDNNPAGFMSISGTQSLQTTLVWTKMTFNLSAFNNQKIYIAIHCVSNDNFLMMIDDLEVRSQVSSAITADFSADITSPRVGENVDFTDVSTGGPTSWVWTFSGGTPATSGQQNPAGIHYESPGTYSVSLKVSNGNASDSITKYGYIHVTGYPAGISLNFDSLPDFTRSFTPWTVDDVNQGNTYGILNVNFPFNTMPMAYICFVPTQTSPPTDSIIHPHSGLKMGCSFSSTPPNNPNDKWLISPRLTLGTDGLIEFWVMTFNSKYGYENFNVALSNTDLNPSSFTALNSVPESAPALWTKKSYSLSAYADQDVYIGIQCVTDDGFIFMLDDISITSTVGVNEKNPPGHVTLYPNPAKDFLNLKFQENRQLTLKIDLISLLGETIRSWDEPVATGTIVIDIREIPQGVYILQIMDGANQIIQKVSVIR